MEYRNLGATDLQVSAIGFGCGAVGGLLVRGDSRERTRAVARAVDLGITYFDTAGDYGDGVSETNLGLALAQTHRQVTVGSKIRLLPRHMDDIERSVVVLVDESLRRLGRSSVDLMQLHNPIGLHRQTHPGWLGVEDVARVLQTFSTLRDTGKLRFWGINGLGDTAALQHCMTLHLHSIQICHNLLNPSAAMDVPPGFPFENQRQLITTAAARDIGVLAFRIVAGGALSGSAERHLHASAAVETIFSSGTYASDVRLAQQLTVLVRSGYAEDLVEAAIRFAVGTDGVSSAVIGFSTVEQMEHAVRSAERGPLPEAAFGLLRAEWARFGLR